MSSKKFKVPLGLLNMSSDPSGTYNNGDIYYNVSSNQIRIFYSSQWNNLSASGAQGIQGIQGYSIQGIQGLGGFQGVQGTTGQTGIQGQTGLQGQIGIQGQQGIQGRQGTQRLFNWRSRCNPTWYRLSNRICKRPSNRSPSTRANRNFNRSWRSRSSINRRPRCRSNGNGCSSCRRKCQGYRCSSRWSIRHCNLCNNYSSQSNGCSRYRPDWHSKCCRCCKC